MKRAFAVLGATLAISIAHYLTPPSSFLWHEILERLYYLPIILGALSFGWIGGVVSAALAALCYAPHIITAWNDSPHDKAAKYAEVVVFVAVGTVAGFLRDRERKRTHELHLRKIRDVLASNQMVSQSGIRDSQPPRGDH